MAPALVRGNVSRAIVSFIEDSRGNLCDILFHCRYCDPVTVADIWPCYEFPADYDAHCEGCGELINAVAN